MSNDPRLPLICCHCNQMPDTFNNHEIWQHYLSPVSEGEKKNRPPTLAAQDITIDDALDIQQNEPSLLFHLQRKCSSCSGTNFHSLFGRSRKYYEALPQRSRIIRKVNFARREFRVPLPATHSSPGASVSNPGDMLIDDHPGDTEACHFPDSHDYQGSEMDTTTHGSPLDPISIWESYNNFDSYGPSETNDHILSWTPRETMATMATVDSYLEETKSILGRCCYQKEFTEGKIANVRPESLELYLKIGELVLTLDKRGRELLSSVLDLSLEEHVTHNTGDPTFLRYPKTEREFQSQYLNPNNANSLVNQIPIPVVEALDDGSHSYSNFMNMIEFISSTANNSDKTKDAVMKRHRTLARSPKFLGHLEKCLPHFDPEEKNVIVMILLWSDGFDPNRTKTNRGSAWALTATYIFYDCTEQTVFMVRTEIISCGRDKDDHSCVFNRMASDMEALGSHDEHHPKPISFKAKSLFFTGREVHYYPIIMGALMDNPERRWNYGLKMGNAKVHGYFGLSCDFSELEIPFAACSACRKKVHQYVATMDWEKRCLSQQHCNACLGLSIGHLIDRGRYREPRLTLPNVPGVTNADIPGISLSEAPGFLSRRVLVEGWKKALELFTQSKWTATTTKSYLGDLLCLNDYELKRFVSEARQLMDPATTPEQRDKLGHYPGLWNLLEIEEMYECIMHQAMNSGSALTSYMFRWTTSNARSSVAIKKASPSLEQVKRLQLSRFRAMPYKTDKLGGYVGENWKTLLLLAPWLYRFLTDTAMAPPLAEQPDEARAASSLRVPELRAWLLLRNIDFDPDSTGPELYNTLKIYNPPRGKAPSHWNENQLRAWLSSRGSDCNNFTNRDEMVREVETLMAANKPVRTLAVESGEECGKILRSMFSAFNSYHASLVSGDLHGIEAQNRSEGRAMSFLSHALDLLDRLDGEDAAEGVLFKRCTMYGTLRAATHFSFIYELNSLDEGGDNGEGGVKKMRRFLTHGLKGDWPRHLQRKMLRGSGLDHMQWCISQLVQSAGQSNRWDTVNYGNQEFRAYKSQLDLEDDLKRGNCLSFVVYADKDGIEFGAIFKRVDRNGVIVRC